MIVSLHTRYNFATHIALDTSAIINLDATGRAREIATALPYNLLVTDAIPHELNRGKQSGRRAWETFEQLVNDELIEISNLNATVRDTSASLLFGEVKASLELGEATTIALAFDTGCAAGIDERKARRICNSMFPRIVLLSTVELLLHENIRVSLGTDGQSDAVYSALRNAKMHVPQDKEGLVGRVVDAIGRERAQQCECLPARVRN